MANRVYWRNWKDGEIVATAQTDWTGSTEIAHSDCFTLVLTPHANSLIALLLFTHHMMILTNWWSLMRKIPKIQDGKTKNRKRLVNLRSICSVAPDSWERLDRQICCRWPWTPSPTCQQGIECSSRSSLVVGEIVVIEVAVVVVVAVVWSLPILSTMHYGQVLREFNRQIAVLCAYWCIVYLYKTNIFGHGYI